MDTSAAHTGYSTTERERETRSGGGRPCNTYLRDADGEEREESAWDAFTSPSGGAQQEPTKPAAPKSFSTHPPTPECLTPLARGNRALSKGGSGVQGDFRRPEDVFSHFCTFLELLQR